MSRYMVLIKLSEDYRNQPIPQGLLDEMGQFLDESQKSGVLIDTGGLAPTSEATRVRLSRGKVTVTDGPFTESKEVVGGYVLVQLQSKQEAIDLATRFMDIHRRNWPELEAACELRRIETDESAPSASVAASEARVGVRRDGKCAVRLDSAGLLGCIRDAWVFSSCGFRHCVKGSIFVQYERSFASAQRSWRALQSRGTLRIAAG